jgi:Domain of unknown function (DUF4342)/zinc-ribbon domain
MMTCSKCGSEISEDSNYCKFCGMRQGKFVTEEFSVAANDVLKRVEELLHEGNITRVIVKDESGKQLLEIPATVGVVGTLLAPWMAALGVIAVLATKCTIVVERRE